MSSFELLKSTELYKNDPEVKHRVDLRTIRDNTVENIKLFNLDIELTTICNLRCKTCYNPFLQQKALSVKDFLYILEQGSALAKHLRLDGLWLTISGGEPFMHPDILTLLRTARDRGVVGIAIITNGTLFTNEIYHEINRLKIDEVMISIDGGNRETHDDNRGAGAYDRMISGVRGLHRECPTIFTGSTLTLTSKNIDQIPEYAKLAFDLGFCYAWINPPLESGRLPGNHLSITKEQNDKASELVRKIDNYTLKYGFDIYYNLPYYALSDPISPFTDLQTACPFARNNLTICADGNVLPCLYSRDYVLGNIFKDDLINIYNLPDLENYRKGNLLAPECQQCQLAAFCGGCRARTYYRTGDWYGKDTWCPLINQ